MAFRLRPITRESSISLANSKPSSTALGTAYEHASARFLSRPPLSLRAILRIGGANDKGIDLRAFYETPSNADPPRWRRIPVIVQCKAVSSPLQPSVIREFEGVLSTESTPARPTIGVLVGLHGFTTLAMRRASASEYPIALLRLGKGFLPHKMGGGRTEEMTHELGYNQTLRDLIGSEPETRKGWVGNADESDVEDERG